MSLGVFVAGVVAVFRANIAWGELGTHDYIALLNIAMDVVFHCTIIGLLLRYRRPRWAMALFVVALVDLLTPLIK